MDCNFKTFIFFNEESFKVGDPYDWGPNTTQLLTVLSDNVKVAVPADILGVIVLILTSVLRLVITV